MLVVRVTENVRAVQSSYYSSCPWLGLPVGSYVRPDYICSFHPLTSWPDRQTSVDTGTYRAQERSSRAAEEQMEYSYLYVCYLAQTGQEERRLFGKKERKYSV
jgi:hypothetical protein